MSKKLALTDVLQSGVKKESAAVADRFAKTDSVLLKGAGLLNRAEAGVATGSAAETAATSDVCLPGGAVRGTRVRPAESSNSVVVRDTFSMPEGDYKLIQQLRQTAARQGRICTKSEIVRAGLQNLANQSAERLALALDAVERIKPGRKAG